MGQVHLHDSPPSPRFSPSAEEGLGEPPTLPSQEPLDLAQAQEVHTSLVRMIRSNKTRPLGCKFKTHGSTRKTSSPHEEHRATRCFSKSLRKISDGMMYSRGHSADVP